MVVALLVLSLGLGACGSQERTKERAGTARKALKREARERRVARLEERVDRMKQRMRRHSSRAGGESSSPASDAGSAPLASLVGSVDGEVGLTLGAVGGEPAVVGGTLESGSAWSTIKVPIVLRVLADSGGPDGLSSHQSELAERAITVSDNEAAAELFEGLERSHGGLSGASSAVTEVLREGGDSSTSVSTVGRDSFSTYGQTEWSLPEQHRFISSLVAGCVGSAASRRYALDLMSRNTDGWGFGALGLPAAWKGGWGPGVDGRYLVRQMGEVEVGGHQVVATVAAIASDGQFESAQAIATQAARWVVDHAGLAGAPSGC